MISLAPDQFGMLDALAAPMAEVHGSVAAVIAGTAEGGIWVDAFDAPNVAVLEGPEGTYLLGTSLDPAAAAEIADLLDDWVYLHVDPRLVSAAPAALPNAFMVGHPRLLFRLAPCAEGAPVPSGLTLVTDADGIGQTLMDGAHELGHCRPDLIVGDRIEIGVWVHPDHRRQDLARLLVARVLDAAKAAGMTNVGWHCHASNRGSIALARRFALGPPVETLAYSASLPAENVGDLTARQCRKLAEHFDAGASQIGWLAFHAACAWALVPDPERALSAVDRLVDGEWQGEPDWLAGHWAMADLRHTPRFEAALARLRMQKAPPG